MPGSLSKPRRPPVEPRVGCRSRSPPAAARDSVALVINPATACTVVGLAAQQFGLAALHPLFHPLLDPRAEKSRRDL